MSRSLRQEGSQESTSMQEDREGSLSEGEKASEGEALTGQTTLPTTDGQEDGPRLLKNPKAGATSPGKFWRPLTSFLFLFLN